MEGHKKKASFTNKIGGKEGKVKIKSRSLLLRNTRLTNNNKQLLSHYSNVLAHQQYIQKIKEI